MFHAGLDRTPDGRDIQGGRREWGPDNMHGALRACLWYLSESGQFMAIHTRLNVFRMVSAVPTMYACQTGRTDGLRHIDRDEVRRDDLDRCRCLRGAPAVRDPARQLGPDRPGQGHLLMKGVSFP